MNNTFKKEKDSLDKDLKLVWKKLEIMDDLGVAIGYLDEVFKLFDNFTDTGNTEEIIKKLYNLPTELSALVMLPVKDIREIKDRILSFVKSNVPSGVKTTVSIHRLLTKQALYTKYSEVVSDDTIFRDVSNVAYYLQAIQVWFACKYVMSFSDEKKAVTGNNNIDTDNKVGANINDFAKELANIHGYESFDDMTDDEKYMALTRWRDHIKTSTSSIDE
jgi:hypothetical protein